MVRNRKPTAPAPPKSGYHHGRLRAALLESALELLRSRGASALSLREVARHAGVSHAAPAHHFGDKAGLLTALATEGFEKFLAAQRSAAERGGTDPAKRFSWTGWAYVMFASEHSAYFSLMFRPELVRGDDPEFQRASRAAYDFLLEMVRAASPDSPSEDELALRATFAWAQAHGIATLWLEGNLRHFAQIDDLDLLARQLFGLASPSERGDSR